MGADSREKNMNVIHSSGGMSGDVKDPSIAKR
jgi:hypothetical protein